ncbi:MAG: 2-methoxy-6-polyprenyl-1,4-benzoquinol methylase, mitochondrial [Syntrophus sp. SKADARSKE-3]|nr:2-methoxy-6-polyprenyl-1,4-benzoquinol methylase, mitochondrial [Syntrophus sp. SKADARSKE-3]
MKRDFDKEAQTWDQKTARIKLAADVASAMMNAIPLTAEMDVLDYGCGTGLLTLALQPHVRTITGADTSIGMLDVFKGKIEAQGLTNVTIQYLDADQGIGLTGSYHLITSSMTLHHVEDPPTIIRKLYEHLYPGGYLCIADLDPDDGKFHSQSEGVFHEGFSRSAMGRWFAQAGFDRITETTAATVTKDIPEEGIHSFSIFLVTGKR